jgi:hypothetical protein
VHVYGLHGGSPLLEATLTASTPGQGRNFGYAVSTDGARLAISDPDDREVPGNIGAVYVFRRVGTAWVEEQVIRPFLPAGGAAFGREVTIDGDNLYAGAHAAWPSQIHHFKRVGGVWIEMGNSAVTNPSPWGVLALDAQGGELAAGVPTVYNESGGVSTCLLVPVWLMRAAATPYTRQFIHWTPSWGAVHFGSFLTEGNSCDTAPTRQKQTRRRTKRLVEAILLRTAVPSFRFRRQPGSLAFRQ